MILHLAPKGRIGLVLVNGALSSQTGGEAEIRRRIVEDDLVEEIIALPTQLFYSVTIPVTLWFFSKNKKNKGRVVFIDARKMGYMVDRTHRDFTDYEGIIDGKNGDIETFGILSERRDIIVIADEAHRGQYGLAKKVRIKKNEQGNESRVIKLKLDNETLAKIDEQYETMAHNADDEVIEKSKQELANMESILGNDRTIKSLVDDIITHNENYVKVS